MFLQIWTTAADDVIIHSAWQDWVCAVTRVSDAQTAGEHEQWKEKQTCPHVHVCRDRWCVSDIYTSVDFCLLRFIYCLFSSFPPNLSVQADVTWCHCPNTCGLDIIYSTLYYLREGLTETITVSTQDLCTYSQPAGQSASELIRAVIVHIWLVSGYRKTQVIITEDQLSDCRDPGAGVCEQLDEIRPSWSLRTRSVVKQGGGCTNPPQSRELEKSSSQVSEPNVHVCRALSVGPPPPNTNSLSLCQLYSLCFVYFYSFFFVLCLFLGF